MIELILALITIILFIIFSPTIIAVCLWIMLKVFGPIIDWQMEKIDEIYDWWQDRKIKKKERIKE